MYTYKKFTELCAQVEHHTSLDQHTNQKKSSALMRISTVRTLAAKGVSSSACSVNARVCIVCWHDAHALRTSKRDTSAQYAFYGMNNLILLSVCAGPATR